MSPCLLVFFRDRRVLMCVNGSTVQRLGKVLLAVVVFVCEHIGFLYIVTRMCSANGDQQRPLCICLAGTSSFTYTMVCRGQLQLEY
jgi:Na+-driven multidrug efflux pump